MSFKLSKNAIVVFIWLISINSVNPTPTTSQSTASPTSSPSPGVFAPPGHDVAPTAQFLSPDGVRKTTIFNPSPSNLILTSTTLGTNETNITSSSGPSVALSFSADDAPRFSVEWNRNASFLNQTGRADIIWTSRILGLYEVNALNIYASTTTGTKYVFSSLNWTAIQVSGPDSQSIVTATTTANASDNCMFVLRLRTSSLSNATANNVIIPVTGFKYDLEIYHPTYLLVSSNWKLVFALFGSADEVQLDSTQTSITNGPASFGIVKTVLVDSVVQSIKIDSNLNVTSPDSLYGLNATKNAGSRNIQLDQTTTTRVIQISIPKFTSSLIFDPTVMVNESQALAFFDGAGKAPLTGTLSSYLIGIFGFVLYLVLSAGIVFA